ncbi:MAG: 16S rRNA (uracil(1498)-N(3))-methyltransferase [Elusimicrobia bacterium]|nr:16S rRNA (uracil(1498)-N(3))-methyltransferase [Elusimicrobiota bacterium]
MPQFFLPPESRRDDAFRLEGPEAFHVSKVLRCREGETIELFDGKGGRYAGKITRLSQDGSVEGVLTATLETAKPARPARLNLYQGLMKASRWEWILEKGTELGVSSFIPVTTARTVVLLREAERIQAKGDRWRKIVLAAAKQCRRADLPAVQPSVALRDALKASEGEGLTLFAWEKMIGSSARETLRGFLSSEKHRAPQTLIVNLFIGPEGGFSEEEVEMAKFHGAHLFALGSCTLRGETAAIASAALILYELGIL